MEHAEIINLLYNAGLKEVRIVSDFIEFRDPACLLPIFDSLFHYAWIVILILMAIMLLGWAALYMFNNVKIESLFGNIKSVMLILTVFAVAKPTVNIIYGDNLFGQQCDVKMVPLSIVPNLLKTDDCISCEPKQDHMKYEQVSISDTKPIEIQTVDTTINSQTIQYTKQTTVYINPDGTKIIRSGGSVAWRNNNPGNIKASQFAINNGAIGTTDKWAVFPDERTGLDAVKKLLRSHNYNNLTVSAAIHRWAPFSDGNNPTQYSKHVSNMTGLPSDAVIQDLSDNDLEKIARAIQRVEGWEVGTETQK